MSSPSHVGLGVLETSSSGPFGNADVSLLPKGFGPEGVS